MADTILVPLELPDPEPLSPVLIEDLASLNVVVLGHYDLPEQTPVRDAREQFGEAAQATLDEIAGAFADAGASVRTRLVFGKDRAAAIRQVATEEECAAELDPAPTEGIGRILVPLPDVAEFDRLPRFIRVLSEDGTQRITLFHVVEGEERRERGEAVVEETRERLIADGFDADSVDTLVVEGDGHDEEILRVAADYDAVVMYEPESSLGDRVFGTLADRIADETGDPVIVVNRDY
ncbi:universal stress protein [Halorubrum sp. SD626R]|jgi:nucleotide-binding universal stress UspA family protein|uniref:universal stress protein n=1 Tax=Halorubrum sp. SD626R TaxID=1419722 RepID=UPI000AFB2152|nr:universal stress protein [Halorubrum sp. SD626R]TKX81710.1 universal stress protein [Halorubrum sp. SD626R]